MKSIDFIQYLRPDGRTRIVWIDRPDHIAAMATSLKRQGLRLECEVLRTEECRFIISDGEMDLDEDICPNGEDVPDTVDRLIERVYNLTRVKEGDGKP